MKPVPKTNGKCGIRNKEGASFTLIERDNEAQFGKHKEKFTNPESNSKKTFFFSSYLQVNFHGLLL